jgi:hypothetical protein
LFIGICGDFSGYSPGFSGVFENWSFGRFWFDNILTTFFRISESGQTPTLSPARARPSLTRSSTRRIHRFTALTGRGPINRRICPGTMVSKAAIPDAQALTHRRPMP